MDKDGKGRWREAGVIRPIEHAGATFCPTRACGHDDGVRSGFESFELYGTPESSAFSRPCNSFEKPRVVFEPKVEPVFVRLKSDQHSGWFSVPSNNDLAGFGFAQLAR